MNNTDIKKIAALIGQNDRFVIFSHIRPDGDTLGCAVALSTALESLGKHVYCLCEDRIPARLSFLAPGDYDISVVPASFSPDVAIAVDVGSLSMLGSYSEYFKGGTTLKIDHHLIGEDFAEYNYTDADAAACAEIIFDIITELGVSDMRAYNAVYAAICSDTGCFMYQNVTAGTHLRAARLIEAGADFARINTLLFQSKTIKEITAERTTLNSLTFFNGGKIALVNFTNDMKTTNGLNDEDIGEISSIPRTIEGVSLGIVIKQLTDDPVKYKVSMRSDGQVDVSRLCGELGGGGHFCAAGATVEADTPVLAEKIVMERVFEYLEIK